MMSTPYPPLVAVVQAITDEAAFADWIDTLEFHPQGADCEAFVRRYNDVDVMCQRVMDDASKAECQAIVTEMRRVRAAVTALERRHRVWAANDDVVATRANAEVVTRMIMQHATSRTP